ncbi:hypothetical protein BD311DRAFT_701857 [Dichomitus squalens]|uniref:F-box domain-containing protein n=1 Tax=Dichomitus squalens TaxID=114155 RepID=A0A4Q9MFF6_9APHY|nr:hypothetical protein BD311DRAFT_701857 [Dichomitus squalens]
MSYPRHIGLPTELWYRIIQALPSNDQRRCLSISRMLHDIAWEIVFSHITIRFGLWRDVSDPFSEEVSDDEQVEADKATRLSCELLRHIKQSPDLACIVMGMTVRAYTYPEEDPSQELIEATVDALSVLRLHAFAWYGRGPEPQPEVLEALIEHSSDTLSELTLPPKLPDFCPFLPSINHLRSLAFLPHHKIDGDLADVFEEHSDALPLLTSCKVMCGWMTAEDIEAFATFLQGKSFLQRLDFVHSYGWASEDEPLTNEPVLRVLKDLPHLTILGCDIRSQQLTSDHLAELSACIPRHLTALSLRISASEMTLTEDEWAEFFEAQEFCRYLQLLPDNDIELESVVSRHPPPVLQLLGYKRNLRWVSRNPSTKEVLYSDSWPASKVYFRQTDDFGCEDWEWLLRHHGQDSIIDN